MGGSYTIKRLDEMDALFDGMVRRARASLGISSFGMQVQELPAGWDGYPNHHHADETYEEVGQEEVYVPLAGTATLRVDGREFRLEPGVFARVAPGQTRKVVPGADGVRMLCLGGVPGKAYHAPSWTEIGAPPPQAADH